MNKKIISLTLALIMALGAAGFAAQASASMSLDKADYVGLEKITVSVSGFTAQMESDGGFVGLYNQGDANNDWLTYSNPKPSTGFLTLGFNAPSAAGNYEMRLFSSNIKRSESAGTEGRLVMSVPFTVGGGAAPAPTPAPAEPTPAPTQAPTRPAAPPVQQASTEHGLSIQIDGKTVEADVAPFIDGNDRTMVPVRFVSEALDAAVGWDDGTQTVTVTKAATVITLVIESRTITVNGADTTMDTAAILSDGRTFVPVRFIAEALGLTVGWDEATQTVLLTTGGAVTPVEPTQQPTPTPVATPAPIPTPTPSTGDNKGLVVPDDSWHTTLGAGRSYLSLEFFTNGTFEYLVYWTTNIANNWGGTYLSDEVYKGTYSASNSTLSLTFSSAQRKESGGEYESIVLPATLSLPYRLWEDRYEDKDNWGTITEIRVYHKLDIGGPLPGANELYFKDGYTLYLYEENNNNGTSQIVDVPATSSWTGKWDTDWEYMGIFDLKQSGNTVTGSCALGNFSGTVSGNKLTINEGLGDYDQLRFTMSPDGMKFSIEQMSMSWLDLATEAVRLLQ